MEKVYYVENENLLKDIEDWFGLDDYENVKNYVNTGTRSKGFGNYEQVSILNENKRGLIPLEDFFENNDNDCDSELLTVEDLKEIIEKSVGTNWKEKEHGNTYNFGGYLEREVDYKIYENDLTDEVLAFFSIHVGLDVRAGYTNSFAMKFDSHYSLLEFMITSFELAYIEYTSEKEKFYMAIDGSATSDYMRVYITNDDNSEILDDDGAWVDLDDTKGIEEYLNDNDIDFDEGTIKFVN